MINYEKIKNRGFPDVEHTYDEDFTILYALALGIGSDPIDENQLRFVNNPAPDSLLAMPTMATVLGFPGAWLADPDLDFDVSTSLNGEEGIVIHDQIPSEATLVAKHKVASVVDKGQNRGALITTHKELFDKSSDKLIATVAHTHFCRADGGFSQPDGKSDNHVTSVRPVPTGEPVKTWSMKTLPQQALMFRLCTDHSTFHSSPGVARAAGFDRPIMHGQCTFGMACFAILESWCNYEPARLKSIGARFSAPLIPGETIKVFMYDEGSHIAFRVVTVERNVCVLDYGVAELL